MIRPVDKGGRSELIKSLPQEIEIIRGIGSAVTLMVWADLDHDMPDGDALKRKFWEECKQQQITKKEFDNVIFIFAKDRLENWIEYLNAGKTDEDQEGPRVKFGKEAAMAARHLADACTSGKQLIHCPKSLAWSCSNWRTLLENVS